MGGGGAIGKARPIEASLFSVNWTVLRLLTDEQEN
jgi:hypothetical protein